jgi:hypothetical protein
MLKKELIMTDKPVSPPAQDLHRIILSAKRLGIELDEAEALQWLASMTSSQNNQEIVQDKRTGVFGHRISMLDFSDRELAHFRKIGELVEFDDIPGVVETALALSGSAAQSKIQTYPGDADYFERVNIKAPSHLEACTILAKIMREKALATLKSPTYQLIEVKFGNYPRNIVQEGRTMKAGTPIAWEADEIVAGKIEGFSEDGKPETITWDEVAQDPGWCKLDWVVADTVHHVLVNASNMLDVTWEAPDGSITPLDGYLDPYFQEIYLDAESIPVFSKLAKQVSADALDEYVHQLQYEVKKYLTKDVNYGKVAKRLYNIFRLTGLYPEAAFLRELFDEPATMLYQVWSLIRTVDDCFTTGSSITRETLLAHCDELILEVVRTLEGAQENEVVRLLLRLREILSKEKPGQELTPQAEAARSEVINIVNNFFHEKLVALPSIKEYMENISR